MTDCIRRLLINCSHLKELFIINHIKKNYYYQSYLKNFSLSIIFKELFIINQI